MRICIITSQYPPINGGLSTTAFRIAHNLAKRAHDVHVIAPGLNSIENAITPSLENGVIVHRTYSALGEYFGNPLEMDEILNYIKFLHQDAGFDIIHSLSLQPAGPLGHIASQDIGCPWVLSVQNKDVSLIRFNPILSHSSSLLINQASIVLSPDNSLLDKTKDISTCPNRVSNVPNCFDPTIFDQRPLQEIVEEQSWRERLLGENFLRSKSKGAFIVGTASIVRPEKCFSLCLSAFKEFQNSHPNACLLHVGDFANIEEKKRATSQIKKMKLNKRVFLTGWVPFHQVISWMHEMDIFIGPALQHGTQNALMEAMGIGLPVIASDVGGEDQLILDGEDGLLVPARATGVLSHMMGLLEKNKDLRKKLGDSAKTKIMEQRSANKETELYQKAYQDAILDWGQ